MQAELCSKQMYLCVQLVFSLTLAEKLFCIHALSFRFEGGIFSENPPDYASLLLGIHPIMLDLPRKKKKKFNHTMDS